MGVTSTTVWPCKPLVLQTCRWKVYSSCRGGLAYFLLFKLCGLALDISWFPSLALLANDTLSAWSILYLSSIPMADTNTLEKGIHVHDTSLSPASSTVEQHIDRAAEKKLVRKLDFKILPILWILYLVNFIDR
jgi:hypothetical protein